VRSAGSSALRRSFWARWSASRRNIRRFQAAMAKVENYTDPERIVALKDGIEANERHQIETSQKWEEDGGAPRGDHLRG
jgi:hypothetical protein